MDVAGDGTNNDGFGPQLAYAEFAFGGVTVNGLVVDVGDDEGEIALVEFFHAEVLRGPGAFVEVAQSFDQYEEAMRRKLEREVRPRMVGQLHIGPGPG